MTADPAVRSVAVEVAVLGGGLAGLATAVHLARRGHGVACLEPRPWPRPAVGESLEFSAAALLTELGIETDDAAPHLYPKTAVHIVGCDEEFVVWPPTWFARPPIWCSRVAFHTDRSVLDARVRDVALDEGVAIIPERARSVERHDRLVTALVTDRGTRVTADWYVDASGHSGRVLGRALGLDRELLGPSRTAYWARFGAPPQGHATRLHFPEPSADELTWVWEIPLSDAETSVGVVMSTARANGLRREGLGPRAIFERQLAPVPRLRRVAGRHPAAALESTTYVPYRHRHTVGPNWVLVGDAAAMVDPLTSNGVTSALRHADGAARMVSGAVGRGRLRRRDAWAYHHTGPANVATLDRAIEGFVYDPRFRRRLGLRWAVSAYAATGVVTNSWYAKIGPASVAGAAGCAAVLAASRAWTRIARSAVPRLAVRRGGEAALPAPTRPLESPATPRSDERDVLVGGGPEPGSHGAPT